MLDVSSEANGGADVIDVCIFGDCRESMRQMIADGVKVQTCVTSPPYWGLRDYGTATWQGGEAGCDHSFGRFERGGLSAKQASNSGSRGDEAARLCKCGARRIDSQLGLESTPEEYVANMVEVFRLVRELLADDGTLWLNLGDSYGRGARVDNINDNKRGANTESLHVSVTDAHAYGGGERQHMRHKDLVGIPWRVAFALQADGWYLRSDIIWHKPNPMPESVTDRPTKAHEYLFLLSKRERYFYDADAIKEEISDKWTESHYKYMKNGSTQFEPKQNGYGVVGGISGTVPVDGKRNRRTVWTVATEPYSEAHFATFPTALIEPCILAGSRVGDTVFDPFMGSGTTAQVAQNLGRHWLGCELNAQYFNLQKRRAAQMGLSLA